MCFESLVWLITWVNCFDELLSPRGCGFFAIDFWGPKKILIVRILVQTPLGPGGQRGSNIKNSSISDMGVDLG